MEEYLMMMQNACIRYDKTLKHKPSTTSRAVYQHEVEDDPVSMMKRMTVWTKTLHQMA